MKKSVVALLHFGYWMMYLFLLLLLLLFLMAPQLMTKRPVVFPYIASFQFLFSFAIFPASISFYIFYRILYAKFLSKKRIGLLFLSGILTSIGSGILGIVMMAIIAFLKMGPGVFNDGWSSATTITIIIAFNALANGIVGLVMKGFITSYGDIKLKEDLNKKNYEMELALIKSQINPHFLFNTINNIDVLIEKDAVKASSYLNKLSDIMRFMLYETKTEKIALEKELTYIEKYIDLQKIRTSNINYINYSVEGDSTNLMIAPMLFIPFIENAFKHTENKKVENAINIKVTIEQELIIFECENKYSENNQTKLDQSGLGNELIRKRLTLLYPDKHKLNVTDKDGTYKVKLTLL